MFFSLAIAAPSDVETYVDTVEKSELGMTLWEVILSGGWVMVVLVLISLVMVSLVAYLSLRLQIPKVVPDKFSEDMIKQIQHAKFSVVKTSCEANPNAVSRMIEAGMLKRQSSAEVIKEDIELSAKKEVSLLWQPLSYLSDIAAVAPMVGLLGTVIGMIQAFNTIAFQTAVVKPILLAGGVSKAMVTTAGGMIIAIIAMIFYSFFRFKIQKISNLIEVYAGDIIEAFIMTDRSNKKIDKRII